MHADQLQVADDPATRIFPIVRPSHDVSDALLFERLLRLADHADLRNGVDEEKTRNGILSKRSVNPPRKQRMSFRQRSVTYVKSFLRAFTREKRYPTCFKFRYVSSPHIDPASMIVVDLAGEKLQDAFCGFRRGCQFSLMMRIAAGVSG